MTKREYQRIDQKNRLINRVEYKPCSKFHSSALHVFLCTPCVSILPNDDKPSLYYSENQLLRRPKSYKKFQNLEAKKSVHLLLKSHNFSEA